MPNKTVFPPILDCTTSELDRAVHVKRRSRRPSSRLDRALHVKCVTLTPAASVSPKKSSNLDGKKGKSNENETNEPVRERYEFRKFEQRYPAAFVALVKDVYHDQGVPENLTALRKSCMDTEVHNRVKEFEVEDSSLVPQQ